MSEIICNYCLKTSNYWAILVFFVDEYNHYLYMINEDGVTVENKNYLFKSQRNYTQKFKINICQ